MEQRRRQTEIIGIATDGPSERYLESRMIEHADFNPATIENCLYGYEDNKTTAIPFDKLYAAVDQIDGILGGRLRSHPRETCKVIVFGSSRYHHLSHALLKQCYDPIVGGYLLFNLDNHHDCYGDTEKLSSFYTENVPMLNCAIHITESLRKTHATEGFHITCKDKNAGFE